MKPVPLGTQAASAFGLFNSGYGVLWFLGSAVIGLVYRESIVGVVVFSTAAQLLAVPLFLVIAGRRKKVAAA